MVSRQAWWIWSSEANDRVRDDEHFAPYKTRLFRKSFVLSAPGAGVDRFDCSVNVSSDTWYQLFCNGHFVGRGPAKGDVFHHFYDTYDIGYLLQPGENLLAARVVDVSPVRSRPSTLGAPTSSMTKAGGFLLQGAATFPSAGAADDQELVVSLDTDTTWTVAIDRAWRFHNDQQTHGGFVGLFEDLSASQIIPDWHCAAENRVQGEWEPASRLYTGITFEDRRDDETPYGLLPRTIPHMEVGSITPFKQVFQVSGSVAPEEWAGVAASATSSSVLIDAGQRVSALLDVGELTTSFPVVRTVGGRGAVIRLTYSEALRLPWGTHAARMLGRQQSHQLVASRYSDEQNGWTYDRRGNAVGFCDIYRPDSHAFTYQPMRFRTFQFVKVEIEVGDEPLELNAIGHCYTAYPFKVVASFNTDESHLNRLWDSSIRTFRLCCHETFEDCPYYEQLQYAGDSVITSQIALLSSADPRLTRQALLQFDWSRIPEGLTQSRYPSSIMQFIPSWSLHWIMMISDYYILTGDLGLVASLIPGMRSVLNWFRTHIDAAGLPARLPFWNIVDWCPDWDRGQPPGWETGAGSVITAQLIVALESYRRLLQAVAVGREDSSTPVVTGGLTLIGAELDALVDELATLRDSARHAFWDPGSCRVRDSSVAQSTSEYSVAWALLAGFLPEEACEEVVDQLADGSILAPASFFGLYYVVEALCRHGRYQDALAVYDRWREMTEFGLSTLAEETTYWRSLCHAWSAHPAVFFMTRILGVGPRNPGFDGIVVAPKTCGLNRASGTVAVPGGKVAVAWEICQTEIVITVSAPRDRETILLLPCDHAGLDTHSPVGCTGFLRLRRPFRSHPIDPDLAKAPQNDTK